MRIEDPELFPYSIKKEGDNYDVVEEAGEGKDGKKRYKTHGHFSNVSGALLKIARLKVETDKVYTIKQYIEELKAVKLKFNI